MGSVSPRPPERADPRFALHEEGDLPALLDLVPRSSIDGITWPAIPDPTLERLLALLFQLERSQWWTAERLREHQLTQLRALVGHTRRAVPFYRDRLPAALGDGDGNGDEAALTWAAWSRLPVLRRAEVQAAGEALNSTAVPASHGEIGSSKTGGSTGTPVRVQKTSLAAQFAAAFVLRNHLWRPLDPGRKLAVIREPEALTLSAEQRRAAHAGGLRLPRWPEALARLFPTGPAAFLSVLTPTALQLAWLARERPSYLVTFPSNARFLAEACLARGIELPGLEAVLTIGEVISDQVRQACHDAWGAWVNGPYSSADAGILALQCPAHQHYHVQAEGVLLEVLGEDGRACAPGEVGEVVVTPLHNFAAPLLRYALGDHAEVGAPCPCGRGLPVLSRVLGRERNMLRLPSGDVMWPDLQSGVYRELAPVTRFQLAQTALDRLELRLVVERPLTADEERRLEEHIRTRFPGPFTVVLTYHDALGPSPSGKYEDFRCEIPD